MYKEWQLDTHSGRQVRYPGPEQAPCGCSGVDQMYACLDYPYDDTPHFCECQECGAVWEATEGDEWQHF